MQTAAVNLCPENMACHVAMLLELFERGQSTELHCVDFGCIFAVRGCALVVLPQQDLVCAGLQKFVKNCKADWKPEALNAAYRAIMEESGIEWTAQQVVIAKKSLEMLQKVRFKVNQWCALGLVMVV